MNHKIVKQNMFAIALILTLTASMLGTLYCVVFGQSLASAHLEPCSLTAYQGILAFAIAIIFSLAKPIRTQPKWFLIPMVLLGFCFLYEFIVRLYPCCTGG